MTFMNKNKIHIPPEWTGEQAKAVWEFLEEIACIVWDVHEEGILAADEREQAALLRAARGEDDHQFNDDDFPF